MYVCMRTHMCVCWYVCIYVCVCICIPDEGTLFNFYCIETNTSSETAASLRVTCECAQTHTQTYVLEHLGNKEMSATWHSWDVPTTYGILFQIAAHISEREASSSRKKINQLVVTATSAKLFGVYRTRQK